ncbi:carbonic anhydrase family protein [Enterococcus viikkiensis]|uniref:carbonic anhydrase family protein n=1 Tax=Enterococcus viikkiensis TaxID=930854 RepID=UPI003F913D97
MKAEFLIDYCQQKEWQVEEGHRQSPIDIQTSQIETNQELGEVQVAFTDNTATFLNNGQNLQLLNAGEACLNKRVFHFVQVHFHADAEHQINGEKFPLEGHFLFQAVNGQQAVIGVLYQLGAHNSDFEQVLNQYDCQQGVGEFSTDGLIPEDKSYYHYIGSLTTPPLTEGVEWYVMEHRLEVSAEQLKRFVAIHGKNNRDCQTLHQRKVLHYQA